MNEYIETQLRAVIPDYIDQQIEHFPVGENRHSKQCNNEKSLLKIAIITPTKDRPNDLRRMLSSIEVQTHRPDQVIVVDGGHFPVLKIVKEFAQLFVDYVRWDKYPSAARQRNGGIEKLQGEIDLVCFFDDDQELYPDAIEKMILFWTEHDKPTFTGKPLGAASFFDDSWKDERSTRFKKSWLSEKLGLYTRKPGGVAPSGWQSIYYGAVHEKNLNVEWMSSQAIVVRKKLLREYKFDEFFEGYSYLEDLDFSYSISRKYRLTVVADAKFIHHHSPAGRGTDFSFGMAEVRNRHYIVQKHGLSMTSFRLAMFVRTVMSIISGERQRALGNIVEAFSSCFHKRSSASGKRSI